MGTTRAMDFTESLRSLSRAGGVCALLATMCTAAPANASAYEHNTTTVIEEVIVLHDGGFYFKLHDNVCATSGNRKIAYAYKDVAINGSVPSDSAMDRMLRVGMAAKLSGATVQIFANDGDHRWGCLLGAIKLR